MISKNIWAAGDIVAVKTHSDSNFYQEDEHWNNALRQGESVANMMINNNVNKYNYISDYRINLFRYIMLI